MTKPFITLIITLSFLFPFSAQAATPSFLEILNPWDSFKSFVGSNQGGIPQAFVSAHQEYLAWFSMMNADHWISDWNLKNGNKCEQLKITHLQNRTKYYLSALRDIQIGWIQGSTDENRTTNIISFLETFLTQEFAKINNPNANYSLFDKDLTCSEVALCDQDSSGEFCTSNPDLFSIASESLGHLQNLFCLEDDSGTINITESNWSSVQASVINYLKKVIEFHQKAQASVSPIYIINLNYDYSKKSGLEKVKVNQATWSACKDANPDNFKTVCGLEPVSTQSCLNLPNYPNFLNVNYQGTCGCPDLKVSWADLRGIFEELLDSLKNLTQLNKIITELQAMVTNAKDDSGVSWWSKFDDEVQQQSKREFKAIFGYFPPEHTSPRNADDTIVSYFTRLFNPSNRIKAAITLTNQSISPVFSLGQILSKLTSDGSTAPILQIILTEEQATIKNAQAKELAALDIKTINLVTFANQALDIAFGIASAGSTLGAASCQEILRQNSFSAISQKLGWDEMSPNSHINTSPNSTDWDDPAFGQNLLKGANSTMKVLDAFFGGKDQENDACLLLRQMQAKIKVPNPSK